jgi:hypothetical protein
MPELTQSAAAEPGEHAQPQETRLVDWLTVTPRPATIAA